MSYILMSDGPTLIRKGFLNGQTAMHWAAKLQLLEALMFSGGKVDIKSVEIMISQRLMMRDIHVGIACVHLFLVTLCVLSTDEKKLLQDDIHYFTNWSYCKSNTDYYKLNYAFVDPPLPYKNGQRVSYVANIDIYKQENWHLVHIFAAVEESFGNKTINVAIIDDNFNACDLAVDILHRPCPIPPGNYNISGTFDSFNLFPVGQYFVKTAVFTEQGKKIVCLTANFTVIN
uniref:MD-2-related lipid-recognition domain-containing protein n=1 Tax=Amphimedon queenslandica TaxID=400682 RepID=A0A1X7VVF3_AMPQE